MPQTDQRPFGRHGQTARTVVEFPGTEIASLLGRFAAEMGYEAVSHHTR